MPLRRSGFVVRDSDGVVIASHEASAAGGLLPLGLRIGSDVNGRLVKRGRFVDAAMLEEREPMAFGAHQSGMQSPASGLPAWPAGR